MANNSNLLTRFPKIVPSYEKVLDKKEPNATIFNIIPKGLKCYLWFTYVEDKNICCLLTLDNKKRVVTSVEYQQMCFNSALSIGQYGTILYGTFFYTFEKGEKMVKCFSCEDIIYYMGNKMEWNKQESFLSSKEVVDLFNCQLKHVIYNKNFIICGLPIITRQFSDAYEYINTLPYKVYGIQQRTSFGHSLGITTVFKRDINNKDILKPLSLLQPINVNKLNVNEISVNKINVNGINVNGINNNNNKMNINKINVNKLNVHININNIKHDPIFKVIPLIQPDIYELYCYDDLNKTEIYYGIAMIPTYKSSVFMNGLFRNIKENSNLDLLEESDDEEEFQNNRENKFVNLDKYLYMKCVFNKKFNKWQPIEVVSETNKNVKLISKKELFDIEQNNRNGIKQ